MGTAPKGTRLPLVEETANPGPQFGLGGHAASTPVALAAAVP